MRFPFRAPLFVALCSTFIALPAVANDFALQPAATQSDMRDIARDLTAGLSPKALSPAESSGVLGFSIGAFATRSSNERRDAWENATGNRLSSVRMLGLSAAKGLPGGIDVAAWFADVSGTDATMFGGEVRYAILRGSTVTPAVNTRLAYARMNGNDDFGFNTLAADVSVSKGFAFLTPYAGAGVVRGSIRPDSLDNESVTAGRVFVGARVTLGFLQLTPEVERIGSNTSTNLRIAIGF